MFASWGEGGGYLTSFLPIMALRVGLGGVGFRNASSLNFCFAFSGGEFHFPSTNSHFLFQNYASQRSATGCGDERAGFSGIGLVLVWGRLFLLYQGRVGVKVLLAGGFEAVRFG